jgi:hypothetical protein
MEENRPDHLDKFFTDSLRSFEDRPANDVWEKIELELDGEKRRVFLPIFRLFSLVAASLIALCIALVILYQAGHKTNVLHKRAVSRDKSSDMDKSTIATTNLPFALQGRPNEMAGQTNRANDSHLSYPSTSEKYVAASVLSAPNARDWRPLHDHFSTVIRPSASAALHFIADIPQLLTSHIDNYKKENPIHLINRPPRWSISGYFSQELAGYNLADHDSTSAGHKEIDKKYNSLVSASAGILLGYQLTKNWLLQSGLLYSWSTSMGYPTTAYAVTDNNGNTKYLLNTVTGYGYLPSSSPAGDSVKTDQSSSRLYYLSIPVIASYAFHMRRFTFLAGAGLIGNFLTGGTVTSRIEGASTPQPESIVTLYGLRRLNYGFLFKAEAQYAIRTDWSLDLMVTSKNSLTAINTNANYSTYPYYIGVGLGITRTF